MKFLKILYFLLGLAGCGTAHKSENRYEPSQTAVLEDRVAVAPKYSLSADRKAFEDVRAQVPQIQKAQNDELAFVLGLLSETKNSPSEIRSRFDVVVRKKREVFDKDLRKEREGFNKEERLKRDQFLKSQRESRRAFSARRTSPAERDAFFSDIDENRKNFFANQKEKRDDFESDLRERRKSFEDYIRERTNFFNQELRAYSKRFEEAKKLENKKQIQSQQIRDDEVNDLGKELQEARERLESTTLESGQ
jgi:hypothetical protein